MYIYIYIYVSFLYVDVRFFKIFKYPYARFPCGHLACTASASWLLFCQNSVSRRRRASRTGLSQLSGVVEPLDHPGNGAIILAAWMVPIPNIPPKNRVGKVLTTHVKTDVQ